MHIIRWFSGRMEDDLVSIRRPLIMGLSDDAMKKIDNAEEILEAWERRVRSVTNPTQSLACWYLLDSILKSRTADSSVNRFRKIIEPKLHTLVCLSLSLSQQPLLSIQDKHT